MGSMSGEPVTLQTKVLTLAAGAALVVAVTLVRACGSTELPPKPAAPARNPDEVRNVLATAAATSDAWTQFAKADASKAGLGNFDPQSLTKTFAYRGDNQRHVLAVGDPPIDLAGLRLTASVEASTGDRQLVLSIENLGGSAVAYQVVTTTSLGVGGCNSRTSLAHSALVIDAHSTERRTECTYRDGMKLVVTQVDVLDVPPLSAWYLRRVAPGALALEERTAKGHRSGDSPCQFTAPRVLENAVAQGTISFRDLADFYARHRCETYEFTMNYRYFATDGERSLPATQ